MSLTVDRLTTMQETPTIPTTDIDQPLTTSSVGFQMMFAHDSSPDILPLLDHMSLEDLLPQTLREVEERYPNASVDLEPLYLHYKKQAKDTNFFSASGPRSQSEKRINVINHIVGFILVPSINKLYGSETDPELIEAELAHCLYWVGQALKSEDLQIQDSHSLEQLVGMVKTSIIETYLPTIWYVKNPEGHPSFL